MRGNVDSMFLSCQVSVSEWSIFIRHDKYEVGNKNKNKLKSAKRFRDNHRQCSTSLSVEH